MRIVIAPDSFKGSLGAGEVAQAIKKGLSRVWPLADYVLCPIADGGEGTVEILVAAKGGTLVEENVTDALGRPIAAAWGRLPDGLTAVVEVAAASGLAQLDKSELDLARATSYGSGLLIKHALDSGAKRLIIGLGGSATNDGGAGLMVALGVKFYDGDDRELPLGGLALSQLARVDISGLDPRLKEAEIVVASDVRNPLCGPEGASAIFGPQKGAGPELVPLLDNALANYSQVVAAQLGRDIANNPGAGAAGGLGAAFMIFTPQAKFRPGIELVLEESKFDELAPSASFIVTGEGQTDGQSAFGKGPAGVIMRGRALGRPVYLLSGSLGEGYEQLYELGLAGASSICPGPISLEVAMKQGGPLLTEAAARLGHIIQSARNI